MTSPMIVRSDHRRTESVRRNVIGWRSWSASQVSPLGHGPSPSVRETDSRPIAFDPRP